MDYESFINRDRVLLKAPAGYGKTYTLSMCLKHTEGRSLVLTHTHAGVYSIKQKLKDTGISLKKYSVETITSFAQRYVDYFYVNGDKPSQEDSANYYPFIVNQAKVIFSKPAIKRVLKATYSGLFVDEYQDCTLNQHLMLRSVMDCFPVRVLGDPLQGIFDFNDELVDFDRDLDDFEIFPPLNIPQRWNQVGANRLGAALADIRLKLEGRLPIDLLDYTDQIEVILAKEHEKHIFRSDYFQVIKRLDNEKSLLVLHPDSRNNKPRINFSKRFKNIASIESIDDKDFYKLAKMIDNLDMDRLLLGIRELSFFIFNKTGIERWFNDKGFKNKKDQLDKERVSKILDLIDACDSVGVVGQILSLVQNLPKVDCSRRELFKSLLKAIEIASLNSVTVLEGMREQRNSIRRAGRRVEGRHIGTTLLTKGLEFDVVVVLDAHKIESFKHLYVALTRCRKRLVLITENAELQPYQ